MEILQLFMADSPLTRRIHVAVVVLGDVGRSPRMRYHAVALADHGAEVDLIGYAGRTVQRAVRDHPHITCHFLRPLSRNLTYRLPHFLFLSAAFLKVGTQLLRLFWALLFVIRKPDIILIQNPPAVPTLLAALLVARLRSARLVVDWHNFGYTLLALKLGRQHPVVRLAGWYERTVGRQADAHLCVSQTMHAELAEQWGIQGATVLYDRPATCFAPTPLEVRRELLRRLQDEGVCPEVGFCPEAPDRPALIVSPTSWTADEDFSLLLDAAVQCEAMINSRKKEARQRHFPRLLILITGEGPLRALYESRIKRLALNQVQLQTLWLSAEDYPLLLGSADLGLCMHRSSSGLDLPMKVADMFGSGLPVCAFDYGSCLTEQVRHGENGLLFTTGAQLAGQLYNLFDGFPDDIPLLNQLRRNVSESCRRRWADDWSQYALPVFTNA